LIGKECQYACAVYYSLKTQLLCFPVYCGLADTNYCIGIVYRSAGKSPVMLMHLSGQSTEDDVICCLGNNQCIHVVAAAASAAVWY